MPRQLWTTPAAIVLSPVLLVAGDPLVRRWSHREGRCTTMATGVGGGRVLTGSGTATRRSVFATDPVVTALTAPSRWVGDRLRHSGRDPGVAGFGWWPPPDPEGVREPAKPRPGPPTDAIALREPPVK